MDNLSKSLTYGNLDGGVDLTLRLGASPYYNSMINNQNVKGKSSTNPNDKLRATPRIEDIEDGSSSNTVVASEILIHLHQNVRVNNPPNDQVAATTLLGISNHVRLNLKACHECGNEETPLWRKGPNGRQTLCNACGLRYARAMKMRKST
ncbi:OLC1v1005862C1 [Oldenlandia corymbosa var. corymbosa]|uniref:OLC1v1005862C1 n=1 Tax=Oldenlandia corymbosa var. corymbosa TaxID=529605 RepID=A0AAV1DI21_OLDCO|nr:OLC1v1005862C1 [Oldenlandia corymbosa var. corymbosa]